MKRRMTMAQAIVAYLQNQYSARDGREHRFIEGIFGIFGHGNVAGIGQALEQDPGLKSISAGTNRRWCIRRQRLQKQVSECGRWRAPLRLGPARQIW